MAIMAYLAMTAAEIAKTDSLPQAVAWMACHLSPYGTGLTNLPRTLPPGSVLILNDRTPIHGHDPEEIARILTRRVEALECRGVLLDLERAGVAESQALAAHLVQALPCPVAVSASYAQALSCPVFLPPVPPDVPLEAHIRPWQGREIWLELSLGAQTLTLTEQGAARSELSNLPSSGQAEPTLHCHYKIDLGQEKAVFSLWRTPEDLKALLEEWESSGVTHAVGLYQELGSILAPPGKVEESKSLEQP